MIHLMSYFRSGNHFTRFICEYFTGIPTQGAGPDDHPIYKHGSPYLQHVKDVQPIIKKTHNIANYQEGNKLIYLIRNPKESLLCQSKLHQTGDTRGNFNQSYLIAAMLKCYTRWPEDKKLHLYYEDLIEDPHKYITQLLEFLDPGHKGSVDKFIKILPEIRGESLKVYDNSNKTKQDFHSGWLTRKSFSKGKDPLFHSKQFGSVLGLKKFDSDFRKTLTDNEYKLIKHYEEK